MCPIGKNFLTVVTEIKGSEYLRLNYRNILWIVSSIRQENTEGIKEKPWVQQLNVFWEQSL